MNIKEELLKEHSKNQTIKIVNYINNDKILFKELMELFLKDEYRVVQRASWVVSYCGIKYPELIKPYLKKMIAKIKEPDIHHAVKRNIVKVWEEVDIPDKLSGEIYTICFNFLQSVDEPIAVKAFSMTVLEKICLKHHELKNELKIIIEELLPFGSAGIIARGKKVLKHLSNT